VAGDRRRPELTDPDHEVDDGPRAAGVDDRDGFVATLTESFLDDPVMSWVFPARARRITQLASLWRTVAGGLYLPRGGCSTLPEHDAVAMWSPPDAPPVDDFWAEHGAPLADELGDDIARLGELTALMDAHHPTEPHWYLLAIGTRPAAQGRGLGSVLLAHTLAALDELGAPSYLEATSARSRALYARFGFDDVGELTLDGGPSLWAMWREPTARRN
jgi:GNAT superfamily N-acetyltransferase